MTDKELHKLKKPELLELLLGLRNELDILRNENQELKERASKNEADRVVLEQILNAVQETNEKMRTLLSVTKSGEKK